MTGTSTSGPKKRFGQHFLSSPSTVARIVSLAGLAPGSRVLEIGPGQGVLTEALLAAGAELTAIEIDRDLAAVLRDRFPEDQLRLIEGDASALDLAALLPGSGWLCVANLPYNVGTGILVQMLSLPRTFSRLVVMLQREVVERLLALPGDRNRGSLSVYAQCRAELRFGTRVLPGSFHPPPKVESAVVVLDLLTEPRTFGVDPSHYEAIVRLGFASPRKTLRRTLADALGAAQADEAIARSGLDGRRRPAELDLPEWAALAQALQPFPARMDRAGLAR